MVFADTAKLIGSGMDAALAGRRLTYYVSGGITTGLRELELLLELGCGLEELRGNSQLRLERVIRPNEQQLNQLAVKIARLFPDSVVISPGPVFVKDWTQDNFLDFWIGVIEHKSHVLIDDPDWMFSSGSRRENDAALRLGVPVLDDTGSRLHLQDLQAADVFARDKMGQMGFSHEFIGCYLWPMTFQTPADHQREDEWVELSLEVTRRNWRDSLTHWLEYAESSGQSRRQLLQERWVWAAERTLAIQDVANTGCVRALIESTVLAEMLLELDTSAPINP